VRFSLAGQLIEPEQDDLFLQSDFYTISGAHNLLGLPFSDARVQRYRQYSSVPVICGPSNNTLFEFRSVTTGKVTHYSPTDIVTIILRRMKRSVEREMRGIMRKVVFAVPSVFGHLQR
jgi:molecular chaperone DnaK (HSP70)